MKALIVEIEGNYAVAMTKNGKFIKIKNTGNLSLGSETDISDKKSPSYIHIVRYGSIAASIIFILGLGSFLYTSPYSYIDVDINPSIEITTNIFDRIIKVRAINEDAESILDELSVTNKGIDDGVKEILGSAIKNGYLKNSASSAVLFTVSSSNNNNAIKLNNSIKSAAIKKFKTENINPEILTQEVKKSEYKKTDSKKVSPGKLVLINKLLTIDPTLKRVDLEEKSIKEITKSIKESKVSKVKRNPKIITATSTPVSNPDPTQEKKGFDTANTNDKNNNKNNDGPKGKANDRPNNKAGGKIKDSQIQQNNSNDKNKFNDNIDIKNTINNSGKNSAKDSLKDSSKDSSKDSLKGSSKDSSKDSLHKPSKKGKKDIADDTRERASNSTSFATPSVTPNATSTVNPKINDNSKPSSKNSIEKQGIKDIRQKNKGKDIDKNNNF